MTERPPGGRYARSQLDLSFGLPLRPARARSPARADTTPHMLAWRCVTVCVDTATRSGWAIRSVGKLLWSGEVDTKDAGELDEILDLAVGEHQRLGLPLVLVLERAWGTRTNTLLALGAAHERWRAAWQRAGQLAVRIVRVFPATWRARVLGGRAHAMPREQVRPLELASAYDEVRCTCNAVELGPDEAAAILISRWATFAPAVGAVLPAKVRALSQPTPTRPDRAT